jgi:hypothetical protein
MLIVPSPDRNRLLTFAREGGGSLIDVGQPGKLDLPKGLDYLGWSAGGSSRIARKGESLVEVSATGSGEVRPIGKAVLDVTGIPDISYDGKQIIFATLTGISSVELDGSSQEPAPKIVTPSSDRIRIPSLSTDRHWIVYDPGDDGVYVRPFPGPGQRRRIGARGPEISFPYWRKDGNEILYYSDGNLMSVAVTWHGEPSFAEPRKLFSGLRRGSLWIGSRPLGASRDGSRIFWLQGPDPSESNVIHIWTYAIR